MVMEFYKQLIRPLLMFRDDDASPLTLVGAGGELAVDETKFSRSYSVSEPTSGRTKVYFLIHFPFTNTRNFDIKYRVTQGANEDFIVGTTTADRTLNPTITNNMDSYGNQAPAGTNKIYTIGSFEIKNDSSNNNGEITLTLKAGHGYILSDTAADNSITIDITGPPVIRMVGAGTTNSFTEAHFVNPFTIDEGDIGTLTVFFLVYLPATVTSNFMISYSIVERDVSNAQTYVNDDFLFPKTENRTLNLATSGVASTNSGKRYIKGSFAIKNDLAREDNGEITLTFKPGGNNYDVSGTVAERRIIVNVTDNDDEDNSTPLVTLAGVSEDSGFRFNLVRKTLSVTENTPHLPKLLYYYVYIDEGADDDYAVHFELTQRPNDNFIGTGRDLEFYYPTNTLSGAVDAEKETRSGKTYYRGFIYIESDDVHEEDGVLTFAIKPGNGYAISDHEPDTKATINVMDNDSPSDKPLVNFVGVGGTENFSDASYSKTYTATEGDTLTTPVYFLMYIPGTSSFTSSISYQLDEGSNNFLAPNQSSSISVASASTTPRDGRKYIRGSFNIANDTVDEANGDITFTLQGGTNYAVSGEIANRTATITVADNDIPKISIARGVATATEGTDSVSFTLSATPTPIQDLTITIEISESGNMISYGDTGKQIITRMITMTANSGTERDLVSLANDGQDEANSTITIKVTACTGVTVADDCVVAAANEVPSNTTTILVSDDEVPKISITGPTNENDVNGNNANAITFTLEANPIPYQPIDIIVNLTQAPNTVGEKLYVGADSSGNDTRTERMLPNNTKAEDTTRGSKTFTVTLQNVSGGDITATVALNTADPNKYALAGSGTTHTTTIVDSNAQTDGPIIEFIGITTTAGVATTSIVEGESIIAKFQVASGGTVSTALKVDVRITQNNFYSGEQTIEVDILTTTGAGETPPIATAEDTMDEADGSITITLNPGRLNPSNKNYQRSSDPAKVSKTINVTDDDTPEVSISRTGGTITEGDTGETNVQFTISATPTPHETITVNLTVVETGDVLSGATNKTKEIRVMMTTSGTANGNVVIANDTDNEANSTVTVQVVNGSGYIPVSNSNDATKAINNIKFVVEDNDIPQVSITRVSKTPGMEDFNFNEGDLTLPYMIVATPVPYQTITINITVTQTGSVIDGAIPQTIDLPTLGMQEYSIRLEDDDEDEVDGEISIQVTTGTGYAPVSNSTANDATTATNTITIVIADNDVPQISVSSAGSVSENDDAIFTLTSNIRPLNELTIRVDLSSELFTMGQSLFVGAGTGDQSGKRTLFITMTPSEYERKDFTVELCDGTFTDSPCSINEDPNGGYITATVNTNPGNEYDPDPAEGASLHRILIIDPETPPAGPIIEIVAVTSSPVVEGTNLDFNFVIESGMTVSSTAPLEINLNITQVGDYLGTHENTVDVYSGGMNSISIPTTNDNDDEDDGSITVEILTGIPQLANKKYQISTEPTKFKQTIIVNDNDVPEVSITRVVETIAEDAADQKFTYTLNANPLPYQEIEVEVRITKTGGNILAPTQTTMYDMSTSGVATGEVNIFNNDDNEANGIITVEVISGVDTGYVPVNNSTPNDTSASTNTITVMVIEDDIPEISISGKSSVSEVDDAVFTLVADPIPHGEITINVEVTQEPNVGNLSLYAGPSSSAPLTHTVVMRPTDDPRGRQTLTLDLIDSSGGSITATVIANQAGGYDPKSSGNAHEHTIHVSDPDSPPNGPVIELVALTNTTITEGSTATFNFQVEAGATVPDALEVNLSIGGEGSFIDGAPTETVNISQTESGSGGQGTLIIQTDDDKINEENGSITVEILNGSRNPAAKNYRISSDPAKVSQTVTVLDNDNSVVSISQVESTATEADEISYRLIANPAPFEEIEIAVEIEETGNVLAGTQVTSISMLPSGTALGEIKLVDDNIDEDESTITVKVIAGTGYTPASETTPNARDSNTITIVVTDDDVPQITITGAGSVSEENDAEFTLMANPVPWEDITVSVTITESPYVSGQNLFSGSATRQVEISATTAPVGQATLTIDLNASFDDTSGGTITVTVDSSTGGKFEAADFSFSHTTQVTDPQLAPNGPVIELVPVSSTPIVEGNPAVFNFQVGTGWTVNNRLEVDLSITQTGNFLSPSQPDFVEMTSDTASISIATLDDDTTEDDGSITLTIFQGRSIPANKNYQISSEPAKVSQTIMIQDDDLFVSVADGRTQTEGSLVSFEFTASGNLPDGGLRVSIRVEQSDSFMKWRAPRSFNMTSNPDTLEIQTIVDEDLDGEGTITVSLIDNETSSYKVGRRTATVTLTKENEPPAIDTTRISVAHTAVNEILNFINPPQSSSPPITNAESSPVIAPPEVSITAVDNQVDEGATARFMITSRNGENSTSISVAFQVEQVRVQVVLPSSTEIQIGGQETVSIAIPTINDNHANEDGYVAVSLVEDSDYNIAENAGHAVVNISDAKDRQNRVAELTTHAQAFIPDLTGTMGANSLTTVSNRIELGLSENNQQILELWGRNSIPGILTASGDAVNENTTSLKSFLGDSSFAVTLNSGDEFAIPTTLWGLGDYQNLSPTSRSRDSINWSGDLFTGHIGIDALISDRLITGISASVSESEVEFESTHSNELQFNSRTTSLNPYLGWTSKDQNSELHATFGMGLGELEIKQESYNNEILDSQSYSFGLSGNQVLFTSNQIFAGTTRLNIKGDSWFAYRHIAGRDGILADLHTNTHHLRIRTEGTHQFSFATGSTLRPLVSIGVRNDVKDQQSVLGLEVISGANYSNPIGLTIAGNGSMLIGAANQIQKIDIESSLTYDHGRDQRGFIAEVAPSWGQIDASIQNTLWDSGSLDSDFEHGQYSNGTSLTSEFGYGFDIFQGNGTLTPISGIAISTNQDYEYLLGTRLGLGSNANFELSGRQEQSTTGTNSTKVQFEGSLNW